MPEHFVANDRLKLVSGLQESTLLLQEREYRCRRMHPVASAGFGEARASGRATLAKRMIFGILSHPKSQHDAFLRMLRGAWNEQKEPHVRGLSIRIGCGPGLASDLTCLLVGKCERPLFLFFRFQLPDRVAQGIHSGNDPAPQCGCRTRASQIQWSLQELNHRRGRRGMKEALWRWTIFALDVAILRVTLIIVVKK